jgi:hypothetical protein
LTWYEWWEDRTDEDVVRDDEDDIYDADWRDDFESVDGDSDDPADDFNF